jgi:hypothetical protein
MALPNHTSKGSDDVPQNKFLFFPKLPYLQTLDQIKLIRPESGLETFPRQLQHEPCRKIVIKSCSHGAFGL